MKPLKFLLIALILMISAAELGASGTVAIYAIIEKVVFEPNDSAPERVQIWGVITLAAGGASSSVTLTPRRGYLYFSLPTLPPANPDVRRALKEWADFKAVAGTGQAVAFGQIGYSGAFSDELLSRPNGLPPYLLLPSTTNGKLVGKNVLRYEFLTPTAPDPYLTNMGLIELSSTGNLAAVVEQLKAALKR